MEEAKQALFNMIEDDEMKNIPVVLLANKQDLPGMLFQFISSLIKKS